MDDFLFLNNSKISESIDHIYPCELEIKDLTEFNTYASYLDCYFCIENEKLVTRRYFRCSFICFMFGAVQFLNVSILTLL